MIASDYATHLSTRANWQPAIEAPTLCEAFQRTASLGKRALAITTRGGRRLAWHDYASAVRRLAAGLARAGLRRGDRIALLLTNRPEFHIVDTAALHLGAVPVSLYPTAAPEQLQHVLDDAGVRMLVTESAFAGAVGSLRVPDPVGPGVCLVDDRARDLLSLVDLLAPGPGGDAADCWRSLARDDLATLIYTSGTTGAPKGVEITHGNVMAALRSFAKAIDFPPRARIVSYLPMAHIAERNASHYLPMALGFAVTCCPSPREVHNHVRDVHPSWFFAVPRIWEKLQQRIDASIEGADDHERDVRRRALERALEQVRRGEGRPGPVEAVHGPLSADERSALRAVRREHGLDLLRAANVGAASSPPSMLEFFHALGVPLGDLWGMSETTGLGTVTPPTAVRFGSVGPAAPGVELAIEDDGELLVRGPTVTRGYHGRPEATAEAIDAEGWLHTGDLGSFDDDGYLRIVGRKKELIINAAGQNMSPALIEAAIKEASGVIAHACVAGDARPYNVAVVALEPDAAAAIAATPTDDLATLAADPGVRAEVETAVAHANSGLARVEQVKRFAIAREPWDVGHELTPTMKMRRTAIATRYADEIEALYAEQAE